MDLSRSGGGVCPGKGLHAGLIHIDMQGSGAIGPGLGNHLGGADGRRKAAELAPVDGHSVGVSCPLHALRSRSYI